MTKRYKALKDLIGMKAGDVLEPGNGYGDLYRVQDLTAGAMIVIPKDHIQTALEGGWIEELETTGKWRADQDSQYWCVNFGSVDGFFPDSKYDNYKGGTTALSNMLYGTGNYFKSKQTTAKVAEAMKLMFKGLHNPDHDNEEFGRAFHEAQKAVLNDDRSKS